MDNKTLGALKWIVNILNNNNIPYRVGGGAAAFLYGSGRNVNDIDISMSGKYFPIILLLVSDYVTAGPKHYLTEKWDCTTLSLSYEGQDIDLTDADTLLMKSIDSDSWIKNKDIYEKWPDVVKNIEGVEVNLMHPKALYEYKQHLSGNHQDFDRKFLEKLTTSSSNFLS